MIFYLAICHPFPVPIFTNLIKNEIPKLLLKQFVQFPNFQSFHFVSSIFSYFPSFLFQSFQFTNFRLSIFYSLKFFKITNSTISKRVVHVPSKILKKTDSLIWTNNMFQRCSHNLLLYFVKYFGDLYRVRGSRFG